jgi:SNF2 family DNA or RNA helicase
VIGLEQHLGEWLITFRFPYDPVRQRLINQLPGAIHKPGRDFGCWVVPYSPMALWLCLRFFPDRQLYAAPSTTYTHPAQPPPTTPWEDLAWLMPFQNDGIRFLREQRDVLLTDLPGLGKSLQTIGAALAYLPCVITAPASAIYFWEEEIRKLVPEAWITVNEGASRATWRIYSHDMMARHHKDIILGRPQTLIVDEAHLFRNVKMKKPAALYAIATRTPRVICVTGTPIINRVGDLFSQLVTLKKLNKRDYWWFLERYTVITQHRDHHRQRYYPKSEGLQRPEELKEFLAPFFLRRTREDAGLVLPPLTITILPVDIDSPDYRESEDALRYWLLTKGQGATKQNKLMRFNQLCRLGAVAKLPALREQLALAEERDVQSAIFCSYLEPLKVISYKHPHDSILIDGSVTNQTRHQRMARFQNGAHIRYALCSLEAGGVAITLTAASCAFFLDIPWTSTSLQQGLARIYRRGQTKPVEAFYLVARNSIDSAMVQVIKRKSSIIGQFLDDEAAHVDVVDAVEAYLLQPRPVPITTPPLDLTHPTHTERRETP